MRWTWRWMLPVLLVQAAPAQFTIEQAISAPFPTALTASRAGGRIAWVFDQRGARNVWIAESPSYKGRRLTNYRADDGQDLLELSWSPDGRYLAFVRGEGAGTRGEYPNPTSDPKGTRQLVYIVAPGAGEPREIGEGHDPAVSSDHVYFVRAGQIWSAPLE